MPRAASRRRPRAAHYDEFAVQSYFIYGLEERPTADDFIHVEAIEDRLDVHNWNVRPHVHRALHQVMLFRTGAGQFLIEDTWHPFQAPTLIVAPAGTVHAFRFAQATSGPVVTIAESLFAQIAAGFEPDVGGGLDRARALPLRDIDVTVHGLDEIFTAIAREYRWAAAGKTTAITALMALLFVAVGRLTAREQHRPRGKQENLFARFRLAVESHFKEPWDLADYARELGVTTARLNGASRAVAQASALDIVHGRLLAEAKRMLLYTMMTTSQTAYSLGFKDPAYFSRWFSKRAGEPPGAFRARRGGGTA